MNPFNENFSMAQILSFCYGLRCETTVFHCRHFGRPEYLPMKELYYGQLSLLIIPLCCAFNRIVLEAMNCVQMLGLSITDTSDFKIVFVQKACLPLN